MLALPSLALNALGEPQLSAAGLLDEGRVSSSPITARSFLLTEAINDSTNSCSSVRRAG